MNNNLKKCAKLITGIVIILIILSCFAVNYAIKNILPYSAIRPSRVSKEQILNNYSSLISPSLIGLEYSDFKITVEDTIILKGWFIFAESKPAKGTIFLLHGIASCKNAMLPFAKLLSEEGFNCVSYDSRANGESGGLNCTFGFYEKRDLSKFIDSAITWFPNSKPYAVYGHSLGAAVSIQALAEDKRLVCGIAESPFADLREIVHDYFARIAYLKIDFIPDEALKYSEQIAHFKVDSVQPALSAKRITQPVMIIHGLQDDHISWTYGKRIFDNLSSKDKTWYPVQNGNHNNLSNVGGDSYKKQIFEFLNKYLKK